MPGPGEVELGTVGPWVSATVTTVLSDKQWAIAMPHIHHICNPWGRECLSSRNWVVYHHIRMMSL